MPQKCKSCSKYASFNNEGEKTSLFCKTHMEFGMVDIRHKNNKCLECSTRSYFNFIGQKKGIYCTIHKKENMVDVINKTCLKCSLRPYFNYENEKIGIYCFSHKKENMVDVVHKTCLECPTRPYFNYENETIGIYCFSHKKENMIDVVHKTCLECSTRPYFNYKDEITGIYCYTHKKDKMINVIDKTCLLCDKKPSFNYKGEIIGIYCSKHKKENMINVKSKKCLTENCNIQVGNKYRGYCSRCFVENFPNEEITYNYRNKELAVVNFIKWRFSNLQLYFNQRIINGISNRRPDILLYINGYFIIIEIDENQHSYYNDESVRLFEIHKDLNFKKVILLRFNPDGYIDQYNNKIKNPWIFNNERRLIIDPNRLNEWNSRLWFLSSAIEFFINNQREEQFFIDHLYYDKIKQDIEDINFDGLTI